MILYNLHCPGDHAFEAWFRDGATYDRQAAAGEISCPVCGDSGVVKAPMAPRVSKGSRDAGGDGGGDGGGDNDMAKAAALREALTALREVIERSGDHVGDKFAEEARKIHYGEVGHRNIYGEATDDQARELTDEGIKVGRVPWLPRTDS